MKIKTIEASGSNEMTTEIGLKKWRGLRVVAEITESEDEDKCVMELRSKLEKLLTIEVIHEPGYRMGVTTWPAPQPQPIPSVDYRAKEKLEIDIDGSPNIDTLNTFLQDAKKYNVVDQWVTKFTSLTNKTN